MKKILIICVVILFNFISYAQKAQDFINSGIDKYDEDNFAGAIEDFSKAIELENTNLEAYFKRGVAKVMIDDFAGAIADYSKAIEINPNYSEAYYKRGLVKVLQNDKTGACEDYQTAGKLGYLVALDLVKVYCK
jgi:Flp pilus assembly protein TadD